MDQRGIELFSLRSKLVGCVLALTLAACSSLGNSSAESSQATSRKSELPGVEMSKSGFTASTGEFASGRYFVWVHAPLGSSAKWTSMDMNGPVELGWVQDTLWIQNTDIGALVSDFSSGVPVDHYACLVSVWPIWFDAPRPKSCEAPDSQPTIGPPTMTNEPSAFRTSE